MLLSLLVLVVVWLALSRSIDPLHLLIGALAAGIVVFVQRRLFPVANAFSLAVLRRSQWFVAFLATLFLRFVVSTVYTCRLILCGGEEGRIVALPVRLRDPVGQFFLLNSITLTPSTISLLLEGDLLYIHWLRAKGGGGDWSAIKESLEERLCRVFERASDARR